MKLEKLKSRIHRETIPAKISHQTNEEAPISIYLVGNNVETVKKKKGDKSGQ